MSSGGEGFYLVEADVDNDEDVLDMLLEIGPGENGFNNNGWQLTPKTFRSFLRGRMNQAAGIDLHKGLTRQITYWLYKDRHPVGVGKLRPELTPDLMRGGGNIGYCIRPAERGKGCGNIILEKILEKAWMEKLDKVLVSCFTDNLASRKIIERNGGELDREEDDKLFFWIRNPQNRR